jgi:hypothetical protein
MTLNEILFEVGELRAPNGDPLRSNIKRFVNRSMKSIQERKSWTFMRQRVAVVMEAGETSAALPANFKELAPELSPVTYSNGALEGVPVDVRSRSELERLTYTPGISSAVTGHMAIQYVFIEPLGPDEDDGTDLGWGLFVPAQYTPQENTTFQVQGFFYLADLVHGTDHNGLTDDGNLGDALVNLVKSMAYRAADPTDPRADPCLAEYERWYKLASYANETKKFSGRRMRW